MEALICQLRGAHPRWGPRRLLYELLDKEGPATGTSVRILPREPITSEELDRIELIVNEQIVRNAPVRTDIR